MKIFFKLLSLLVLIVPISVFAQYSTLVGIPGVNEGGGDFDSYLQAVYATSISLAALLAVIKIVIAGVKWMTTGIVSSKEDAKKDIEGAILGLVVILAAVLILYIINPNIGAVSLEFAPAPRSETLAGGNGNDNLTGGTPFQRLCQSEESGGCNVRSCDSLGNYTFELMAGGALLGTAIPGVGNIVGAGIGAAAGWGLELAGNETECQAVCLWLDGEMSQNSSGDRVCIHPNDSLEFRAAELETRRAELRIQYNCPEPGRLIIVGDGFNCIEEIDVSTGVQIISSLGVNISTELQQSVLTRIENSQLQEILVYDAITKQNFGTEIDASEIILLAPAPDQIANTTEYESLYTQVEGICNDIAAERPGSGIGAVVSIYNGQNYVACAQP